MHQKTNGKEKKRYATAPAWSQKNKMHDPENKDVLPETTAPAQSPHQQTGGKNREQEGQVCHCAGAVAEKQRHSQKTGKVLQRRLRRRSQPSQNKEQLKKQTARMTGMPLRRRSCRQEMESTAPAQSQTRYGVDCAGAVTNLQKQDWLEKTKTKNDRYATALAQL